MAQQGYLPGIAEAHQQTYLPCGCPLHRPCRASCTARLLGPVFLPPILSWKNICLLKCFHVPSHSGSGSRARLHGELAVSRALGDAPYRNSGLIAEPELAPWRVLEAADALLLLASDGLFETLPADEACRIALAVATGEYLGAWPSYSQ